MRNLIFILILAMVSGRATICPAQTASKPPTPLEQILITNSTAVAEAQKAKNTDFLQRALTDDFVQVGSEGKLHDKDELIGDAHDGALRECTLYNLQVVPVNEDAAIVTYDSILKKPEGDDGWAPRYQHISDMWVKQDGQWRLRFEQATAARPVD